MDPLQVSAALRHMASAIDKAPTPSKKMVVDNLKTLMASMDDRQLAEASESFGIDMGSWKIDGDMMVGQGSVTMGGDKCPLTVQVIPEILPEFIVDCDDSEAVAARLQKDHGASIQEWVTEQLGEEVAGQRDPDAYHGVAPSDFM